MAEQNARVKAMYGKDPSKKKPKGPPRAVRDVFDCPAHLAFLRSEFSDLELTSYVYV